MATADKEREVSSMSINDTFTVEEMKQVPQRMLDEASDMTKQYRGIVDDASFEQNASLFFVGGLTLVENVLVAINKHLPVAIGFYQVTEGVQGEEALDEDGVLPGLPDFELGMSGRYFLFSDGKYHEVDKNKFNEGVL